MRVLVSSELEELKSGFQLDKIKFHIESMDGESIGYILEKFKHIARMIDDGPLLPMLLNNTDGTVVMPFIGAYVTSPIAYFEGEERTYGHERNYPRRDRE